MDESDIALLASLSPLAPENWPSELSSVLEEMQGNPINVHGLMANNPALLNAWWAFRNYSVEGGALGKRNAELLILRVAVHMKSWYEWGSHLDRALKVGIGLGEINDLLLPLDQGNWSDAEKALVCAVDDLTQYHQIQNETRVSLNTQYTNNQIMDLIAIHGAYLILAAMIDTWDLALDSETFERISDFTDEEGFLGAAQEFSLSNRPI